MTDIRTAPAAETSEADANVMKLEAIVLPVANVDRAYGFYS